MLRFMTDDGTAIVMIDARNVEKLRDGQPLKIPSDVPMREVVIAYGITLRAAFDEFERAAVEAKKPLPAQFIRDVRESLALHGEGG